MMDETKIQSRKTLLSCLVFGFILPQIILLCLNIYNWQLISGEVNQEETHQALIILLVELAILTAIGAVTVLVYRQKITIDWRYTLVSLSVHVSYIWFFYSALHDVVPDAIQPWILNEGNVGRWTTTLIMPAAFLSLYALTKDAFSSAKESTSTATVFGFAIGIPALWYVITVIIQPAYLGQFGAVILIIIFSLSAILFLAGVIRLFDNFIHKQVGDGGFQQYYLWAVILGVAAPLGGLALNASISFPGDFQAAIVYILTVINGLLLIIKPKDSLYSPFVLALRFLMLPFICYFFLVFLPFLPLSIFAILLVGAGFLMLTPLALGLFQARATYQEFGFSVKRIGTAKTALICALSFAIMPSYFVVQAQLDKYALNCSLDYFYAHDYNETEFDSALIERASTALVQLRDRKEGAQLPYISAVYNKIVFGDLVLTDAKISAMYNWLNGADMPAMTADLFGGSRRGGSNSWRFRLQAPTRDVDLADYSVKAGSGPTKTLYLSLQNNTADTHALYVEKIQLPDGVYVSGLRLKIEDKWVDGRLFDRKTALWVFQKITEVRRDPALLHYLSSNELELRVYPFPANGIREVEIDFTVHPSIDADITLGSENIELNAVATDVTLVDINGASATITDSSVYEVHREPYLHFILDYSQGSTLDNSDYVKAIQRVATELSIDTLKITAANITSSPAYTGELINADAPAAIRFAIEGLVVEKRAGLWVERSIVNEIKRYDQGLNRSNVNAVPKFVVLSHTTLNRSQSVDLNNWRSVIPDMSEWYYATTKQLTLKEIGPGASGVMVIKDDNGLSVVSSSSSAVVQDLHRIQLYNPLTNVFETLEATQNAAPAEWSEYASTWADIKPVMLNPHTFEQQKQRIHEISVNSGLLLPSTAYIVVERASQWEILQRKEKQALGNHSGLEFENETETSEPMEWLLLLLLVTFVSYQYRRTKKTQVMV